MIYTLRRHDLKFYVVITVLSTLFSISSIYIIASKYGRLQFSEYAYTAVITQIIFTISDLGTKISYFKVDNKKQKLDYKYLLASKLVVATILFVAYGIVNRSSVYFSFILTVIGTSIFPTAMLQEYRLYTIISINNLLFRGIPLLFISLINSIFWFSLFSGFVLFLFSLFVLFKLKIVGKHRFMYRRFKIYFGEVLQSNKYLSYINILSVIEINIHSFVSKYLFSAVDFADFIYLERYVNFLKQSVIYLYDYLLPKINLQNLSRYSALVRRISFLYLLSFIIGFSFLSYFDFSQVFGIRISNLFYFFCLYPLSTLAFNFVTSVIFYRYSSDRTNLFILLLVIFIKTLLMLSFSKLLGIQIIPIALIVAEILMGLLRYWFLPVSVKPMIKII